MRNLISKTFGLRDGEILISFLMQLYIFIIITVLLIVKPTVNALFVSELGADSLPFGYLLVALVAVTTSFFYSKAIRKHSLVKITVLSLIFFSFVFLVLGFIIKYQIVSSYILYFYYVFVSLFAVVATSQFWIFANMVFNPREAKRIFGFIGAGAIAGGIFGGYLTSLIARFFGNEYVIFVAAILILGCIPILQKVYKLRVRYLNIFKRKQVIANQDRLESSSIRLILKSKHLTYVALITGISVVVAKLVDFQFSDFANKAIPNSNELAAFFGFWFSTFNVVALSIQLFLTNKVLARLGVSSTLLILPFTIALGSLLFLTFPELWVLVLIKGIDGSLKQSLNKAAVELSIMPIPLPIKNQAKSYIDVAVDSIATGFAGFLLIFLIRKLDLNTSYITVIVLLFVFISIFLIYKLREAYFDSFKRNIQKNLVFGDTNNDKSKSENNLTDIKNILLQGDEEAILAVFNQLKDYNLKLLQKPVIQLLQNPSTKVKIAAIDYLDAFDDNLILDQVEALVHENDDTLVYYALDYILGHSPLNEQNFFNRYLNHKNEYIANGALLSLAKLSQNNYSLSTKYFLKERLEEKVQEITTSKTEVREELIAGLLLCISYSKMIHHYDYIHKCLLSDNPYIVEHAILASGITSDNLFIAKLLVLLEEKKHRKKAIKALKSYGPKIIDVLLQLEKKDDLKPSIKRYIPKIVGSFKNENAVNILLTLLENKNSTIRLESSKTLKKIFRVNSILVPSSSKLRKRVYIESGYYKNILAILTSVQHQVNEDLLQVNKNPNEDLYEARKKLSVGLELELEKILELIFNLLSILYNEGDMRMTYNGIKSNIKEAKINSLELLDNLLEGKIKTSVLPIVEHNVVEEDHYDSSIVKVVILTEINYLKKLVTISGSNLRQLAVELINASKNKEYIPVLRPLKKFKNKFVKQLARETVFMLKKL